MTIFYIVNYRVSIFFLCDFQRIDMAYFPELRSTVDKNLERFLKSCVFYFLRNTKGEMTGNSIQ